jgi:hypothetical protein
MPPRFRLLPRSPLFSQHQLLPSFFTFATLVLLQQHKNKVEGISSDGSGAYGSRINAASVFTCQALLGMLIFPMNVYPW